MSDVLRSISPVIQLPGTHQCWAAVVAMMLGRHGQDNQRIIHQIISEAQQFGVPMGLSGDSLDSVNGPTLLAQGFRFNCINLLGLPNLPDGAYFAGLLRTAPFGLFGTRPNYGLHAIAINRLHGDFASLGSTLAHGIDPMSQGRPFSRTLFSLVASTSQPGVDFVAHWAIWR